MTNVLSFIIASFATYYTALSVTKQDGPFEMFLKLRNLWTDNDWVGRGIRCHVCVSLYTAALAALALWALGDADMAHAWLLWPALAGASVLIDKYWSR